MDQNVSARRERPNEERRWKKEEKEGEAKADLGSHNEARSGRVDSDISGHESNVSEIGENVSVLLIRESLDEDDGER